MRNILLLQATAGLAFAACQWTAQPLPREPRVRIDIPERTTAIRALLPWAQAADIRWQIVQGDADLVIRYDGPEGCHTSAMATTSDGLIVISRAKIDDGADLYSVILHEVGHALGLEHIDSPTAVMRPVLTSAYLDLGPADASAARAIYGVAAADKVTAFERLSSWVTMLWGVGFRAGATGRGGAWTYLCGEGAACLQ